MAKRHANLWSQYVALSVSAIGMLVAIGVLTACEPKPEQVQRSSGYYIIVDHKKHYTHFKSPSGRAIEPVTNATTKAVPSCTYYSVSGPIRVACPIDGAALGLERMGDNDVANVLLKSTFYEDQPKSLMVGPINALCDPTRIALGRDQITQYTKIVITDGVACHRDATGCASYYRDENNNIFRSMLESEYRIMPSTVHVQRGDCGGFPDPRTW